MSPKRIIEPRLSTNFNYKSVSSQDTPVTHNIILINYHIHMYGKYEYNNNLVIIMITHQIPISRLMTPSAESHR